MTSRTEPTSAEVAGELSEEVQEVFEQLLVSPDIESSSATVSASSLPTLRNDNGEDVWRLTEKAMAYLRGLRGLPFRTVDEVRTLPGPKTLRCDEGETSEASCD